MSTFFYLKPENSLTATVHIKISWGSEKKKSAQAEKTLNKLRKTDGQGWGPRGRKRKCFPFLLFQVLCPSVCLQILTTPSSSSLSVSLYLCICCLVMFNHCSLVLPWVLFLSFSSEVTTETRLYSYPMKYSAFFLFYKVIFFYYWRIALQCRIGHCCATKGIGCMGTNIQLFLTLCFCLGEQACICGQVWV